MILPCSKVRNIPNLWIIPIGLIPQEGRWPCLIYDYTYIGINNATIWQAYREVVQCGSTLDRLLTKILSSDLQLETVYLSKVDLSDAHMCMWLREDDAS